jgi:N-acetylmuramoyl-L-alanine amidase
VAKRENAVILMEDDYLQKYEGFDPNSSESYIIFELMQNKHLEQSITLASEIQNSFAAANRRNRGVKQAGFLVLRKTSMPAVLIELGFISNRDEEKFMASNEGRIELAKSIFSAFSTFKNDYDRKNGDNRETNEIIYKIQILMSDKIIPENSPKFKGYDEISYYREGNYYKYTYGSTADFKQILDMYRHAAVDFKGCFIIKTKDGKRIK